MDIAIADFREFLENVSTLEMSVVERSERKDDS